MGSNRCALGSDSFARQFVAGLGHPELIGRKLRGVHAVHQVVFGGNALLGLDVIASQASVKPLVSGVVENSEHTALHASLLGCPGEHFELFSGMLAQLQTFYVRCKLVSQLLAPSLNGEIFLGQRDLRLAGITVLCDQVAGEPGEMKVRDFTSASRTEIDHFAGAGKMVVGSVARLSARLLGAFDGLLESAPLGVAQHGLEITGAPVFHTVFVGALQTLKARIAHGWDDFVVARGCWTHSILRFFRESSPTSPDLDPASQIPTEGTRRSAVKPQHRDFRARQHPHRDAHRADAGCDHQVGVADAISPVGPASGVSAGGDQRPEKRYRDLSAVKVSREDVLASAIGQGRSDVRGVDQADMGATGRNSAQGIRRTGERRAGAVQQEGTAVGTQDGGPSIFQHGRAGLPQKVADFRKGDLVVVSQDRVRAQGRRNPSQTLQAAGEDGQVPGAVEIVATQQEQVGSNGLDRAPDLVEPLAGRVPVAMQIGKEGDGQSIEFGRGVGKLPTADLEGFGGEKAFLAACDRNEVGSGGGESDGLLGQPPAFQEHENGECDPSGSIERLGPKRCRGDGQADQEKKKPASPAQLAPIVRVDHAPPVERGDPQRETHQGESQDDDQSVLAVVESAQGIPTGVDGLYLVIFFQDAFGKRGAWLDGGDGPLQHDRLAKDFGDVQFTQMLGDGGLEGLVAVILPFELLHRSGAPQKDVHGKVQGVLELLQASAADLARGALHLEGDDDLAGIDVGMAVHDDLAHDVGFLKKGALGRIGFQVDVRAQARPEGKREGQGTNR